MLIMRPHRTARNDEACWRGTTVFYLSCWAVFLRAYSTQSCVSPLASLWTGPFLQDSKDSFRGFYGVSMPHQGRAPFLTGSEEWEPSKPPHTVGGGAVTSCGAWEMLVARMALMATHNLCTPTVRFLYSGCCQRREKGTSYYSYFSHVYFYPSFEAVVVLRKSFPWLSDKMFWVFISRKSFFKMSGLPINL